MAQRKQVEWYYDGFKTEKEARDWILEARKLYPNGVEEVKEISQGVWRAYITSKVEDLK